jgi:hypothetical protein
MKHSPRRLLAVIGIVLLSGALQAHHGAASFDPDQKLSVKGTVTEWLWANPHCFLKIDVKDEKTGAVVNWSVEFGNPTDISIRGFRRSSFKVGDEVSIVLQPVRNGSPVARVMGEVVLANGQKL